MTKHTPGPWEVHKNKRGIAILHPLTNTEGEYKGKLGGYHVVIQERQLTAEGIETKLEEANARLIAAAPELLEVLKDIVEYQPLAAYIPRVILKVAKQAIAKAEGN